LLFYYLHLLSFFFYSSADHRDLHSFPTRRSSDLYEKMGEFLKLSSGKLAKLARLQRRDELKKDFEDPPAPMFQEVRELVLRKCRSEEHTSELQSRGHLVCRLLLEKKKKKRTTEHA